MLDGAGMELSGDIGAVRAHRGSHGVSGGKYTASGVAGQIKGVRGLLKVSHGVLVQRTLQLLTAPM